MLWIDSDGMGANQHSVHLGILVPVTSLHLPNYEEKREVFATILSSHLPVGSIGAGRCAGVSPCALREHTMFKVLGRNSCVRDCSMRTA